MESSSSYQGGGADKFAGAISPILFDGRIRHILLNKPIRGFVFEMHDEDKKDAGPGPLLGGL